MDASDDKDMILRKLTIRDFECRTCCIWCLSHYVFITVSEKFKGAAKFYFTHYLFVVIILFNTGLYKAAFSVDSFGK